MKLFLYSDFCAIKDDAEKIRQSILGDISKTRVLFIPYADKTATTYKQRIKEKLYSIGITKGNITELTKKTELPLFNFGLIVVSGGNSLRMLEYLKKYNQFDYVKNLVKKGIPYIGDSAGSVVVGNNVKYTETYEPYTFQTQEFAGYESFCFVDKTVIVHTSKQRLNHFTNEVYDDELYYGYYMNYKKKEEEKPHISIANNQYVVIDESGEKTFTNNW